MSEEMKEIEIFDKFKLGDKVWFSIPKKSKIPGIIEVDRIQSVGKQRDIFIAKGYDPFVPFAKITPEYTEKITRRRKEFPGEKSRLRLHNMGIEKEYIDWKKKDVTLSDEEKDLLRSVKNNYTQGAYETWYYNHGFTAHDIQNLISKGLILRQRSAYRDNYILVPKGKVYA